MSSRHYIFDGIFNVAGNKGRFYSPKTGDTAGYPRKLSRVSEFIDYYSRISVTRCWL